jgi:hypothetical protein
MPLTFCSFPQPTRTPTSRRLLVWLFAFCALIGLSLGSASSALAHGHGHSHGARIAPVATAQHEPAVVSVVVAASTTRAHDEDDHQHTGDPLIDLLTLGHTHTGGGTYAGLPPAMWGLPIVVLGRQPIQPWQDRPPGDAPPGNPFRPPIA